MSKLLTIRRKHGGRGMAGKVTVRHKGGEHKRYLRSLDFRRDKLGIEGKIVSIEYDPNRTSRIALVSYNDGDKRYILTPNGLTLGDTIVSGATAEVRIGNALPLSAIPIGTVVHNVELTPGRGGQLARGAGSAATVAAKENGFVHLKLPSGEIRKVQKTCLATVGQVGNVEWKNEVIGKAGRARHMGRRPTVRGVAQNPRSHPHGGGEGRSGIGMPSPKTYKGRIAVGRTRNKHKYSDRFILQRRKP